MCESCGCEQKIEQTKQADCYEGGKKGLFEQLNKKQAFVFGIVEGFLVLCTVGFFIMLGIFLSGGISTGGSTGAKTVKAPKQFGECLDSNKKADVVSSDQQLGASLGVEGTPATFINGYLISGAYPYEAVSGVIDNLLAGQTPKWDTKTYGELTKVEMPDFADAIWKGSADAKVTLVEFSDFECPYCSKFNVTVEQIIKNYGDKIKLTYRHFPLSFHPSAQKAAEAFECAKDQGKAWEMHDKLFILSGKKGADGKTLLNLDGIKQAANELKLK